MNMLFEINYGQGIRNMSQIFYLYHFVYNFENIYFYFIMLLRKMKRGKG